MTSEPVVGLDLADKLGISVIDRKTEKLPRYIQGTARAELERNPKAGVAGGRVVLG